MEVQFHKIQYPCLKQVKWEVQNTEQTQELRLPDGMPDVSRVLTSWGQVLMRSKDWKNGWMSISGGVMVWVLYEAEEEGIHCVETWIPFQIKWDLSDTEHDGIMDVICTLRSVDARTLNARKLMVRASVGCLADAWVADNAEVFSPVDVPDGVQLLKKSYPLQIPREAGEKIFTLEESLKLPSSAQPIEKLIYFSLNPVIADQKVMAGRVVFRGTANLHILYLGNSGRLHSWDFEIPFSQFSDLEQEYDLSATARIHPAVTSLELELCEDESLLLKAGVTGQYLIFECPTVEVVEDAYLPGYNAQLVMEEFGIARILDTQNQRISAETDVKDSMSQMVDVTFYLDNPQTAYAGDDFTLNMSGQFQTLYYDMEDRLQSNVASWEKSIAIPADYNVRMQALNQTCGVSHGVSNGGGTRLNEDVMLSIVSTSDNGLTMVKSMELGEPIVMQEDRPSVILCRVENTDIWNLAKKFGSTVDSIKDANKLDGEPKLSDMLLIPMI